MDSITTSATAVARPIILASSEIDNWILLLRGCHVLATTATIIRTTPIEHIVSSAEAASSSLREKQPSASHEATGIIRFRSKTDDVHLEVNMAARFVIETVATISVC